VREIRTLRSTWRGLETWHGIGLNRRASPRPYLRAARKRGTVEQMGLGRGLRWKLSGAP
jgi:hypothetical protein